MRWAGRAQGLHAGGPRALREYCTHVCCCCASRTFMQDPRLARPPAGAGLRPAQPAAARGAGLASLAAPPGAAAHRPGLPVWQGCALWGAASVGGILCGCVVAPLPLQAATLHGSACTYCRPVGLKVRRRHPSLSVLPAGVWEGQFVVPGTGAFQLTADALAGAGDVAALLGEREVGGGRVGGRAGLACAEGRGPPVWGCLTRARISAPHACTEPSHPPPPSCCTRLR